MASFLVEVIVYLEMSEYSTDQFDLHRLSRNSSEELQISFIKLLLEARL